MTNLHSEEKRISVADGLRGFAIIAITLLHSINHFNLYIFPEKSIPFFQFTDPIIKSVVTAISSGKSYGVFALLFGFTFYLQLSNQVKRGNDFSNRFIWRMFILFLIGTINSAFFAGEILVLYSLVGLVLVPLRHVKTRHLMMLAAFCLMQPVLIAKIIYILIDQNYTQNFERYAPAQLFSELEHNSFFGMIRTNFTLGKEIYWLSIISNGERIFQAIALFILGLLLGRKKLFEKSPETKKIWGKYLLISLATFLFLKFIRIDLESYTPPGPLRNMIYNVFTLWSDFSLVIFITAIFMKIYSINLKNKIKWIEPIGKMSLTNYILQSILGSFLFYGYGLSLSEHCGITSSFLVGLFILAIQYYFSTWWLKHHQKGPVEQLWHYFTWIKPNKDSTIKR